MNNNHINKYTYTSTSEILFLVYFMTKFFGSILKD